MPDFTACKNETKAGAFSEEDVCIVSKRDPCIVWAGTKIMYSGFAFSGLWASGAGPLQGSGYNYHSNESDVEPISASGWGEIRIPELNQLHHIFVFPKDPSIIARANYLNLTLGPPGSGNTGNGACSGKVALISYCDVCTNLSGSCCSGEFMISGENFNSGLVDIIAFGSEF